MSVFHVILVIVGIATAVTGFRSPNSFAQLSTLRKAEGLSIRSKPFGQIALSTWSSSSKSLFKSTRRYAAPEHNDADDDEDDWLRPEPAADSVSKVQLSVGLVKDSLKLLSSGLLGLVKKLVIASFYLFSFIPSGTLLDIPVSPTTIVRTASIATASAVTSFMTGSKKAAQAASPTLHLFGHRQYKSLTALQRLGTTPVYFVANSRGNAFLQDDAMIGNPEQKTIVYYMSSEDATSHLEEMAQSNPSNAHEFHLVTTTLEKVVENIIAKKQSRKIGRYPIDVIYRIQPSTRQMQHATMLQQKSSSTKRTTGAKNDVTLPMFSAPGLVIKRSSGELITPYYFALEDLQEDWLKMSQASSGTIAAQPSRIKVHDMKDVLCLAQGITPEVVQGQDLSAALTTVADNDLKGAATDTTATVAKEGGLSSEEIKAAIETPGIIPPRREIDMVKRYYRQQQSLRGEFSQAKLSYRPE